MLSRFFFGVSLDIITWILQVGTTNLRLPVEVADGAIWLIDYFFVNCADLFFFFIRPTTFWVCMDFLFLYWAYKPVRKIKEWALSKVPVIGTK